MPSIMMSTLTRLDNAFEYQQQRQYHVPSIHSIAIPICTSIPNLLDMNLNPIVSVAKLECLCECEYACEYASECQMSVCANILNSA